MHNDQIHQALAQAEVRIQRARRSLERLTRLARLGRLLTDDESVPPVTEGIDHLKAAVDTLNLLRNDLLTESGALQAILDGEPPEMTEAERKQVAEQHARRAAAYRKANGIPDAGR